MELFISTMKMILFLGVILYLVSISLKFLNRYTVQSARGIKILQKVSVTKNSSIGVVKIATTYYLMSFSESQNQILKELDPQEVIELKKEIQEEPSADIKQDFATLVKKSKEKIANNRRKK